MIMRVPPDATAEGLRVMLSPVAYFGESDVGHQLWGIVQNVNQNCEYLKSLDRERVKAAIFYTLVSAAVSIKHIGFHEEKEWRVIYLPRANPSNVVTSCTEVLAGVPQIVHKIPLAENPSKDVIGVGIPALVDRIIIGPTAYAAPMYAAFIQALADAGVPDAASRVVVSGIPIRS